MCLLYPLIFNFRLAFVLVNDLSLVSRFFFFLLLFFLFCFCFVFCLGNAYDFVFVFVAVCFFLLCALVFYVYCRVLPDVLSLMFFHVPPLGFLK